MTLEEFGPLVAQALQDAGYEPFLTATWMAVNYRGYQISIPQHWLTIKQAGLNTSIIIMMCQYMRGPVQLFVDSATGRGVEVARHDYLGLDESVDAIVDRVKAFESEIVEAKKLGIGKE